MPTSETKKSPKIFPPNADFILHEVGSVMLTYFFPNSEGCLSDMSLEIFQIE